MKYNRISKNSLINLSKLTGNDSISTSEADIQNYAIDETPGIEPYHPEVVIRPNNSEIVSKIMTFANSHLIPVTPRGAGTGLSGGCVPLYGGIVLSLERMNRILNINANNFTVIAEPGVSLTLLDEALISYGLYYPIHIGEMSATLGGTIATNAGGINAVKYGVTRQHVLGLDAALPNGKIITHGGEYIKCSTGYDLTQLLIGSEGTLGIVTKIILKVLPRPLAREILLVPFTNLQSAINTVPEILRMKTIPTGLEFMERDVVHLIEKYMETEIPHHDQEAFLLIVMEGESSEDIIQYFEQLEMICRKNGAVEFFVPSDEIVRRKLIEFREKAYQALKSAGPFALVDAVVPRENIARFLEKIKRMSNQLNMTILSLGHAGDGNLHLHPICLDGDTKAWKDKLPAVMNLIYKEAVSFGGTISGEHGIGFDKRKYLSIAIDRHTLELMKAIKSTLDPNTILNPGKIFE